MLFKSKPTVSPYNEIEEKIKKDLISMLKRKGVDISIIQIDLQSGNLNVSLSIKK